jgi:hypothetical protein
MAAKVIGEGLDINVPGLIAAFPDTGNVVMREIRLMLIRSGEYVPRSHRELQLRYRRVDIGATLQNI